jgi:hypothetical protein
VELSLRGASVIVKAPSGARDQKPQQSAISHQLFVHGSQFTIHSSQLAVQSVFVTEPSVAVRFEHTIAPASTPTASTPVAVVHGV